MTLRNGLLVAHILVFGIWLGTDVATFLLSRKVLDRSIELPSRQVLARVMLGIEVIARLSLPTMLALGVALSVNSGLLDLPRWMIGGVMVPAALWVGLVWTIHRSSSSAASSGAMSNADLVIRSLVCALLWVVSLKSLLTDSGPVYASFLAGKLALYALIMSSGIAIRFALRPFAAAFAALVAEGSNAEREVRLSSSLRVAQLLVGVIWLSLICSCWLAVSKALPWE
jgi:hypothetical protein